MNAPFIFKGNKTVFLFLPWLDSRSFPGNRRVELSLDRPDIWSARRFSPGRRSAVLRTLAWSVSSCHPCPTSCLLEEEHKREKFSQTNSNDANDDVNSKTRINIEPLDVCFNNCARWHSGSDAGREHTYPDSASAGLSRATPASFQARR